MAEPNQAQSDGYQAKLKGTDEDTLKEELATASDCASQLAKTHDNYDKTLGGERLLSRLRKEGERAAVAGAEKAETEVEELKQRNAQLEAELKRMNARAETAEIEVEELKQRIEQLEAESKQANAHVGVADTKNNTEIEENVAAADARISQLTEELSACKLSLAAAAKEAEVFWKKTLNKAFDKEWEDYQTEMNENVKQRDAFWLSWVKEWEGWAIKVEGKLETAQASLIQEQRRHVERDRMDRIKHLLYENALSQQQDALYEQQLMLGHIHGMTNEDIEAAQEIVNARQAPGECTG